MPAVLFVTYRSVGPFASQEDAVAFLRGLYPNVEECACDKDGDELCCRCMDYVRADICELEDPATFKLS